MSINSAVLESPAIDLMAVGVGDGIEIAVGNTPLLPLRHVTAHLSPRVKVLAKAEWFNLSGSVKARPALSIIQAALADGSLTPGKHLIDATSGNMGIAYATLGTAKGIPVTLAMSAKSTPERISILRALGAEILLTDPDKGTDGAIARVQELVAEHPERYFYANQFDNPANWLAHYKTTGPEIYQQTHGEVTHFVAGMGTSGTLMGAGRYLRQVNPAIQLVAVQPDGPANGLIGLKHMASAIKPKIYDPAMHDRIAEVSTEAAYAMTLRLAREEGLFVGVSAGAAAEAAIQIASELEEGVVVTLLPDSGDKYLSEKDLWDLWVT